jgi:hypothetical protein
MFEPCTAHHLEEVETLWIQGVFEKYIEILKFVTNNDVERFWAINGQRMAQRNSRHFASVGSIGIGTPRWLCRVRASGAKHKALRLTQRRLLFRAKLVTNTGSLGATTPSENRFDPLAIDQVQEFQ